MADEELNNLLPPQLRVSAEGVSELISLTELEPRFLFDPGDFPTEGELGEILRHCQERGYVLLWSTVLQDRVVFVKGKAEEMKVPEGFVVYTDDELQHLFGLDAPPIEQSWLRLIHEAKKRGGVVRAREWALNWEGKGEKPDELG